MTHQPQWNQAPDPGDGSQQPYEQQFREGRPYFDGQTPQPQDPAGPPEQGAAGYGQPTNMYGQAMNAPGRAPVPYAAAPSTTTTSEVNGRLVRGLLINGAFVVVALVVYFLNDRLPWLILGVGGIGVAMTLWKYFQGRAAVRGR